MVRKIRCMERKKMDGWMIRKKLIDGRMDREK